MIYFTFNGYRNDQLVITPVSWIETQTVDDPLLLDVEIVVTGEAFYDTTEKRDDALEALGEWFAIESGTFAILYQHDDGNILPATIVISQSDCDQSPEVVDFVTSGATFSFRVIAKRRLAARTRNRAVVSRDLTYSVSVTGGSGTVHAKLYSGGESYSITQTGTIGLDGNFVALYEFDAFGAFRIDRLSRTGLNVDPLTLHITSVFTTQTTTTARHRYVVIVEEEPE